MSTESKHKIFSYGTLRQSNVQLALYGREVQPVPDSLPGWRLEWIQITDSEAIAASGSDRHPILRPGEDSESVTGAYLELNDSELAATDKYEVSDYVRREVKLQSGVTAFAYVSGDQS